MERDTFIFRRKWYEAIKALDNETKAQVFDTICEYALYHHTDIPTAPMVQMAMAFITPELIADCEAWLKVKQVRSEAGKRGNAKRWGEQSQNIANARNCEQMQSNDSKPSQTIAKIADNVSSLSMLNNNSFFLPTTREMPKEKKEEFIFEIGKKILLRGFKKPITEATAFFNHNNSTGWIDGKGRRIQDASAWVDGWQCKPENYLPEIQESAQEFIAFLTFAKIRKPEVLEGFRGLKTSETEVILTMTRKAHDALEDSATDEAIQAMKMLFGERNLQYHITR